LAPCCGCGVVIVMWYLFAFAFGVCKEVKYGDWKLWELEEQYWVFMVFY
jgi:hypothetical protein